MGAGRDPHGGALTPVPPLGPHWTTRKPPIDATLENCRQGVTLHFDNAARRQSASALAQTWARYEGYISQRFFPLLQDSPRGNPPRHPLHVRGGNYLASVSSIEFAAMASRLVPALEGNDVRHVIEIGGGYGGLAEAVLLTMATLRTWSIIDIPEVARISRWYLEQWGERVLVTGPNAPMLSANAVVQTRGFMEMSEKELAFYFGRIQDGTLLKREGLLWTINRLQKVSRFMKYPFDRRWHVLYAARWPEADMIEVLVERTRTDQLPVANQLVAALANAIDAETKA